MTAAPTVSTHAPLTILGAGYVGRALLERFPHAQATHRQHTLEPRTCAFRLDDPDSWRNPPVAGRTVVWTFPAEPPELVERFHDACLQQASGLIVLGSTSAYRRGRSGQPPATVDEHSPLDLGQARVAGEEWLRAQGATVLRLAGIFGPGREPEQWLRSGRISDGARIVNLIHVADIVSVIAHLLVHPRPGACLNVANGEPVAWRELAARFERAGEGAATPALQSSQPGEYGRRVDVRCLQALLPGHRFRRP